MASITDRIFYVLSDGNAHPRSELIALSHRFSAFIKTLRDEGFVITCDGEHNYRLTGVVSFGKIVSMEVWVNTFGRYAGLMQAGVPSWLVSDYAKYSVTELNRLSRRIPGYVLTENETQAFINYCGFRELSPNVKYKTAKALVVRKD